MNPEDTRRYRSLAAKFNYYSMDRPDLLYPVKELMRKMSNPDESDEVALKRVARYLIGKPREVTRFIWAPIGNVITTFVDSDFAGCLRTRTSISGGVTFWGDHLVKTWSKTQATVAKSQGIKLIP